MGPGIETVAAAGTGCAGQEEVTDTQRRAEKTARQRRGTFIANSLRVCGSATPDAVKLAGAPPSKEGRMANRTAGPLLQAAELGCVVVRDGLPNKKQNANVYGCGDNYEQQPEGTSASPAQTGRGPEDSSREARGRNRWRDVPLLPSSRATRKLFSFVSWNHPASGVREKGCGAGGWRCSGASIWTRKGPFCGGGGDSTRPRRQGDADLCRGFNRRLSAARFGIERRLY